MFGPVRPSTLAVILVLAAWKLMRHEALFGRMGLLLASEHGIVNQGDVAGGRKEIQKHQTDSAIHPRAAFGERVFGWLLVQVEGVVVRGCRCSRPFPIRRRSPKIPNLSAL